VSSSRREPSDLAAVYSRKAKNDATAAREFAGNAEISDEIIGFHAQQAVEKWLKAVMANLCLPQQRTHDIDQLGRILEEHGVELPAPRSRLAELTDFAVPLRYEDLLDAEPLDRRAAIALVDEGAKAAKGVPEFCSTPGIALRGSED
jgi:HEPN domain-containing protein